MTTFIVVGLVIGGIYAISALGLVLTFRSSRIFNFAHGAIAFTVAMAYHQFHSDWGWSTWLAALVGVGVFGPALGVLLWAILFRHLTGKPATVKLVSTIGLYVALPPVTQLVFGSDPVFSPPGFFPVFGDSYQVLGVPLNLNQITVLVAAVVVALGMTVLLRYTTFGLQIRAVVDSERQAQRVGVNTDLVSAISWAIGTFLAGLAGVLLTPILGLEVDSFTILVIASFAAVVVARMESLTLAFGGAVLLGVVQHVAARYLPTSGVLSVGVRPSIPFLMIVVFLLLYQRRGAVASGEGASVPLSAEDATAEHLHTGAPGGNPWWDRIRPFLPAVAGLILVPVLLPDFWVGIVSGALALAVVFLSFTVVTGEGGVISLCQVTFAGVGAVVTGQLVTELGWPWLVAVLLGGIVAVVFGLLVALPALRLGDLYLALGTLAFALLMDNLVFPIEQWDRIQTGVAIDRPVLGPIDLSDDVTFFLVMAAAVAVAWWLVANLRRSTTGMTLSAVRTSPIAASTLGISLLRAKLTAFGVAAFIAGVGGGLLATNAHRARPGAYSALLGVIWLAVVVTLGVRRPIGAVLAGLAYGVMPALLSRYLPESWHVLPPILFGLGAIRVAQEPEGVIAAARHRRSERKRKRQERAAQRQAASEPPATSAA